MNQEKNGQNGMPVDKDLSFMYQYFSKYTGVYADLDAATGIGKGYGFTKFCKWFLTDRKKEQTEQYFLEDINGPKTAIHRVVYLCDRKNLVQEHYTALMKEIKEESNIDTVQKTICYLPSNLDCLIAAVWKVDAQGIKKWEADDRLKEMKEFFREKQHDAIVSFISFLQKRVARYRKIEQENEEMKADMEKELSDLYSKLKQMVGFEVIAKMEQYRREKRAITGNLEDEILSEKEKKVLLSVLKYERLYEFFPEMKLSSAEVIYTTVQKALHPVSTIFFGNKQIFHESFARETGFFLDESDTMKESILTQIAEDAANSGMNLLWLIQLLRSIARDVTDQKFQKEMYEDGVVENAKNAFIEAYDAMKVDVQKAFFCDYSDDFVMYNPNTWNINMKHVSNPSWDPNLINSKGIEYCIYVNDKNTIEEKYYPEQYIIKKRKDAKPEDIYICSVKDFVKELSTVYRKGRRMLRTMVNKKCKKIMENGDYYYESYQKHILAARDIIKQSLHPESFGSGMPYQFLVREAVEAFFVIRRKNRKRIGMIGEEEQKADAVESNFFTRGFDLVRVYKDGPTLNIKTIALHDTPEGRELAILAEGGSVLHISATASLKGAYSNFCHEYCAFAGKKLEWPDELKKRLEYYIEWQQLYAKDYDRHHSIYPIDMEMDYETGAQAQIQKLLFSIQSYLDTKEIEEDRKQYLLEEISAILSKENQDHIGKMIEKKKSDSESFLYYLALLTAEYAAVFECLARGANSVIVFNNFGTVLDKIEVQDKIHKRVLQLLDMILKKINKEINGDFFEELHLLSKCLPEKLKQLKEKTQARIQVVACAPYPTLEKGVNPEIYYRDINAVIPMNERGFYMIETAKENNVSEIETDAQAVIIARPTNLAPCAEGNLVNMYIPWRMLFMNEQICWEE